MKRAFLGASLFLGLAGTGRAAPSTDTWKDSGEFSYVQLTGNNNTQTLSLSNDLTSKSFHGCRLDLNGGALLGETGGVRTAERYQTKLSGDRDLNFLNYIFGELNWERNRFSGLNNRYGFGGGYGHYWIKAAAQMFKTSGGMRYVQEERTTAEVKRAPTVFARGLYSLKPAPPLKLEQSLQYDRDISDGKNWGTESVSSAQVLVSAHVALKVGYQVTYRHDPVPGFKRADALFSTALVVSF